jgi:hypothetical protein
MAHKEEKKPVPPYLPYKTFKNFLEGIRVNGVPPRVDRSVMSSLSGASQSSLMLTLKYFNLVSPNGVTEENLRHLVTSQGDDRKKILSEILKNGYPFLFASGFDLKSATAKHFEEQFAATGTTGDTTKKCISFFLAAAKDAGIPMSSYLQKYRRIRQGGSSRSRRQSNGERHGGIILEDPPTGRNISKILLDKFPSFDPAWPDDVKKMWFEGFKELRKMMEEEE